MDLTLNDLFSGCGGMGLGFKQAGWKIVGSWDWDKYAVKSYAHNVEEHVQQADIGQMTWEDLPKATAWSFGFPCQDLSVAGNQAGMKIQCQDCNHTFNIKAMSEARTCPECDSDNLAAATRSGLFFEVMRILRETRQYAAQNLPAFILAENVKGLRPYLNVLQEEYKAIGYTMHVKMYNSKYWGVPQSRERYYVVGVRDDLELAFEHPTEQTSHIPRLSSILEPIVHEKYYMPDEKAVTVIQAMMEKLGTSETTVEALQTIYTDKDGCAYCCDANYAKGTSAGDVGGGRRTQVIQYRHPPLVPYVYDNSEVAATNEEPQIQIVGRLDIKGKDQWKRVFSPNGLSPTLTAVQGGLQEAKIFDHSRFRVRKLTPREYARLQGFPDTYEFVCSDSQTYKQLGNAVTVNVAQAVAGALRTALEGSQ